MPTTQETRIRIRWMIRRDMQQVLAIESEAFESPWDMDDFIENLRRKNCIGMVAENSDDKIVGFMIYELHKNRLHILNFAVAERYRRMGIGSQMVGKLAGKLPEQHRNRIMLEIRETNLPAQLFFRECGFRCVSLLNDFYDDTDEDAYLMQYRYGSEQQPLPTARAK